MKRWSLPQLVAVLDGTFTDYLTCRGFWTLGEVCQLLWELTRHPSGDDDGPDERSRIIAHVVSLEVKLDVQLSAGDVCRNLPWYATLPTFGTLSFSQKQEWQSPVRDLWWLHVVSLAMGAADTMDVALGASLDATSLLIDVVSNSPSSQVPAGYLDNLCALGFVKYTYFPFSRGRMFLSPGFLHLHALHRCEMPVEAIVNAFPLYVLSFRSDYEHGVQSMWNWLSRIKSDRDSIHHHLLSHFFSGLSETHGDAVSIPGYGWRFYRSSRETWDIWRDLAYACNSWPVERLCSPWTASCSLRQERVDYSNPFSHTLPIPRAPPLPPRAVGWRSRLVSSMVWVPERRRQSYGRVLSDSGAPGTMLSVVRALVSDSAGLGKSPPFMGMRREEQNGQQQLPQQQLLLRRQQLQLGQQQQQQLRRVLKWQQPPKASAVRRPVQGHRQGMRCGQPRKR
mmetsp:Transcript_3108/g.5405  ORF Transcript_3108/g.5405 Transcript_3108/m.5405 type:complete len:451 (-) Transcript_3108:83-1435(-)